MSHRPILVLFVLGCSLAAFWMCPRTVPAASAGSGVTSSSPGTPASDFIKSLQRELKRAGYDPGAVDGKMGPTTRYALKQFQQAQGLSPTGTPDIPTMTRLLGRDLPH